MCWSCSTLTAPTKKKKNFFRLNQFPNVLVFFAKTDIQHDVCLTFICHLVLHGTYQFQLKLLSLFGVFLGSLLLGEDEGFFWFVEMVFFQLFFWLLFFFSPLPIVLFFSFGKRGRDFFFFWQHVLDHFNSLFFCTIQSKAKNLEAKLSYKSIKLIHKIFTHKRLNQST